MENRSQSENLPTISIIIPVHNGGEYLEECLSSILKQSFPLDKVEISIYDDASTDNTCEILEAFQISAKECGARVVLGRHHGEPSGCGSAKNRAIAQSTGTYLCFLDTDDVMDSQRLEKQLASAVQFPGSLVGSRFHRLPPGSTKRYTDWANYLPEHLLAIQVFTSHGPTIIQPTWFCSRETFDKVGGFSEDGRGTPEDLIFFYNHLDKGGTVVRVDQDLLMYRYHLGATTFSIKEETIWRLKLNRLEETVLPKWESFTIWNAGKQGRRFFRSLSTVNQNKVIAFCDVSPKLILKGKYIFEESLAKVKPEIPIIHFTKALPPMVICMKIDLTEGEFERNLQSMNLQEGFDYVLFA